VRDTSFLVGGAMRTWMSEGDHECRLVGTYKKLFCTVLFDLGCAVWEVNFSSIRVGVARETFVWMWPEKQDSSIALAVR
jgi:hypothetical protein